LESSTYILYNNKATNTNAEEFQWVEFAIMVDSTTTGHDFLD
jgi:hypothetical protein